MEHRSSYVLLTCDVGKKGFVKEQLESFDEVKEITCTYGIYDVVLRIECESDEKIEYFVKDKIRNTDHVMSTLSLSLPEWGSITLKNNTDASTIAH